MTAFEPGEGWRPLRDDEILGPFAEVITHSTGDDARSWVRIPRSVLPTKQWTVIAVRFPDMPPEAAPAVCVFDGTVWRWTNEQNRLDPTYVDERVEVRILAQARAAAEHELVVAREGGARAALEQARHRIATHVKPGFELMADGSEDAESAGYVAGLSTATALVESLLRQEVLP